MKRAGESTFIPILLFLMLIAGLIGYPGIPHADYPDMDINASPHPVGSGARAMGMGGAFISVADDATAASWNPGGLLQLTRPEVSIVGSLFSGRIDHRTSGLDGDIDDISPQVSHLNYLSAVVPFQLFRRNMVVSLNYQHLYEFSQENVSTWKKVIPSDPTDITQWLYKKQRGSLSTISPALAIQVTPSLFIGCTFNIWDHNLTDTGWENITIQDETGIELGEQVRSHSEIFEEFDVSGYNLHLGFLYTSDYVAFLGNKRRFRIGGVVKTPFNADIRHTKHELSYVEYPGDPASNTYFEDITCSDLTLRMPLSYGMGMSMDWTDAFSCALDVYRTLWERFVMVYPNGVERSPINRDFMDTADVTPTTQIRIGAEYLIQDPTRIIPIRIGAFYDPEPARGRPDDIYGVTVGSGVSYKGRFSFDCAYQLRFGEKRDVESMGIRGDMTQHFVYASIIYYLQ